MFQFVGGCEGDTLELLRAGLAMNWENLKRIQKTNTLLTELESILCVAQCGHFLHGRR